MASIFHMPSRSPAEVIAFAPGVSYDLTPEFSALEAAELTGIRIERLYQPVEFMRFCLPCDSEQRFVADRVCSGGLLGYCGKCGDERIAPFTRARSEGE